MIIKYSKEVLDLVHQKRWIDAAYHLLWEWQSNQNDLDAILCYGCALWYLLTYDYTYVELSKDPAVDQYIRLGFEGHLSLMAEKGFLNHKEDPRFQVLFGWIMSIHPYYFFSCGVGTEWDEVENTGLQMIKSAYEAAPHDPLYQAAYFTGTGDYEKARNAYDQVASQWETYFEDDGFVGSYFLAMFSSYNFPAREDAICEANDG